MNEEIYNKNPKKCKGCDNLILYKKRRNDYCSQKCGSIFSQRNGGNRSWTEQDKLKQSLWAKKYNYRPPKMGFNKSCLHCKCEFYIPQSSKNRKWCSKNCFIEYCNENKYLKGKSGGLRNGSGRGKCGWYKGYYCSSSWELAWVIYQLEHGLKFERNKNGFQYEFNNKKYKFYPDFIINGSSHYVEVKGYIDDKVKAKIAHFPHKLEIIGKEEIKPFVNYSIEKYGKDYVELYEK